MAELEKQHEAEEKALKLQIEAKNREEINRQEKQNADLAAEIERLKAQISSFEAEKKAELADVAIDKERELARIKTEKEQEIADLKTKLTLAGAQQELKLQEAENASRAEMAKLQMKVSELNSQLENEKTIAKNAELELKKNHEILVRTKDEEIERLKDMKSRLSTKMLGESLEQHCDILFKEARSNGLFEGSTFEKDNDASTGSKGDFIFRDYIDGKECVSIMFEMKTEMDSSVNKHKNEDFFAKLDKDRTAKGCEYAVLVSTLEAENELYNRGIVDVSYAFDKMFVIRPQFFIPIISLLSRASKRNAGQIIMLRNQLKKAEETSLDITKFEEKLHKFADKFKGHVAEHFKKHEKAMDSIDKAITAAEKQVENLKAIKSLFEGSLKKLEAANGDLENDFTIRKLTHGNPTMRAKFDEARNNS